MVVEFKEVVSLLESGRVSVLVVQRKELCQWDLGVGEEVSRSIIYICNEALCQSF